MTATHAHLHLDGDGQIAERPCTDPDCPMKWCSHGPEVRCFDCATDTEMAAAVPDW